MSLARTGTGLLYQSDGTLAGWSGPGQWSSAADPCMVAFAPRAGLSIFRADPASDSNELDGVREAQLFIEGGVWWLVYDASDHRTGWRTYLATSLDRGRTWTRLGPTGEGYARGDGGTVAAYANGWVEKRGATYYRYRVCASGSFPDPNVGLPSGTYTSDCWSAPSLAGPWTAVPSGTIPLGSGWMGGAGQPGSILFDGATFHQFYSGGSPGYNVGRITAPSPAGPWTRQDPVILQTSTPGVVGSQGTENGRAFYHPVLGAYVLLANSFGPSGPQGATIAAESIMMVSRSLTDWSTAKARLFQRLCPLDGVTAAGVPCHATGPDGALIYDAATGIMPLTWDADPGRYSESQASSPWHLGRRIRAGVLEPSAACLRYSGSGDAVARRLARPLAHADVTIEAAIEFTAGVGSAGASLAIEYRDDATGSNCYRATLAAGGGWSLQKVVGGAATAIGTSGGSQTAGADGLHRIKIQVAGDAHTLWLDGEVQVTAVDHTAPLAAGTTLGLVAAAVGVDVRCLSARTSDAVVVTGLTPNTAATVRSHGGLAVGTALADGSGTATFRLDHYPTFGLELATAPGTDYATSDPTIWGGDTLAFAGLPAAPPPPARTYR